MDNQPNALINSTKDILGHIIDTVRGMDVLKREDYEFLTQKGGHLAQVFDKTFMWRTYNQKLSIISDDYHPTLHSKFHQAILEQKVQLDQAFYLAKDYETKKLEIEELMLEISELELNINPDNNNSTYMDIQCRKLLNAIKKKTLEIKFKEYELKQMRIAMDYRMREVKDWQKIQEQLISAMKEQGIAESQIWSKEEGEIEDFFYTALTNMRGIANSTDAGEVNNLAALARFAINQAKEVGIYRELFKRCNTQQFQALKVLGETV